MKTNTPSSGRPPRYRGYLADVISIDRRKGDEEHRARGLLSADDKLGELIENSKLPKQIRVQAFPDLDTKNDQVRLVNQALRGVNEDEFAIGQFRICRSWVRVCDVVHLHWPENTVAHESWVRSVATGAGLIGSLALMKLRGSRVVRTLHDDGSHAEPHPWLAAWIKRSLGRLTDGYILLSDLDHRTGSAAEQPATVIKLPKPHDLEKTPSRADARAQLHLSTEERLVGAIGRIVPYKQVPVLIDLADSRPLDAKTWRLVVAGEVFDDELEQRRCRPEVADHLPHILRVAPLSAHHYLSYLNAMDVVVLPYRNHLNSGVANDALALGVRVAVTRSPVTESLAAEYPGWVELLPPITDPAFLDVLDAVVARPIPNAPAPTLPSVADCAASTIDCYRDLLARGE